MLNAYRKWSGDAQGALWLVVSAVFFTGMTFLIKALRSYPAPMQACVSQVASLCVMIPVLVRTRGRALILQGAWIQFGRSASAALGVTLAYFAVQKLPLSDANALSFTRALWMVPLAALVLRDHVARGTWIALAVGFLGAMLVIRPSGATDIGWAHMAGLGSAFLLALSVTGIKLLTRQNSLATIMTWSSILGVVMMVPFAIGAWRWPTPQDSALLALLGLLSVLTTASYIHGMSLGAAATLAPVDYVRLPMAIAVGFLLFGEIPGLWSLIGAALIVATTLWLAIRPSSK